MSAADLRYPRQTLWADYIRASAGALLCGLHSLVCQVFLGNQVVSGLALTLFGVGLSNFLGTPYVGQATGGFQQFGVPLLADIPVLGAIFFRQDTLV